MINQEAGNNPGIGANSNLPQDLIPHKGNFFNLDPSVVIPEFSDALDLNFNGAISSKDATKTFAT